MEGGVTVTVTSVVPAEYSETFAFQSAGAFTLTKSPSAKFTFTVKEASTPPAIIQDPSATLSGTLMAHSKPFTTGIW